MPVSEEGMDMEALLPIIIQAVTGVIGGFGASSAMKQIAISAATKIISGVIGGVAGGQIVTNVLSDPAVAGAFSGVLGDAVGGVAGGGILTAIVGMVMKSMNKA
jgi:hypothetical protein